VHVHKMWSGGGAIAMRTNADEPEPSLKQRCILGIRHKPERRLELFEWHGYREGIECIDATSNQAHNLCVVWRDEGMQIPEILGICSA